MARERPTLVEQEQAFLAAIDEAPDEDTSRLVYADWLEENGQPARAEFLRLQCRMARCSFGDERWGGWRHATRNCAMNTPPSGASPC
jgi:uncharacterized protein (TIGR02996 family)